MSDEVADITRLACRAIVTLVSGAPKLQARLQPAGGYAFSGEQAADVNFGLVLPSDDAITLLDEGTALARRRGHPAAFGLMPGTVELLGTALDNSGLVRVANTTMMVFSPEGPVQQGRPCRVLRADAPPTIHASGDIVAEAFKLPRDAVAYALETAPQGVGGAELLIGECDGLIMSAVTVVRVGDVAGIWCMATSPEHGRKGSGRALLASVLEQYRQEGVEMFYLIATAAGLPVYERIGFRPIADVAIYMPMTPATT